ncbi:hypothetical protein XAR_4358 [Xanthomonas citri pv. glycines str. 8ra]|nr:hypothetical protein XAR_4358 [Xanthomonas citri pv. glycines str. 8ra]
MLTNNEALSMLRKAWDGRYGRPVLTRQLSDTRCEEGRTWGYDDRRATVWVNDGCRARFEAR